MTAVLLIYHGMGHYHACFRMAKALSGEYDVVFAGHRFFQELVRSHGFEFYPLDSVPFALGFETWLNTFEKKKRIYWNALRDRRNQRLFYSREAELRKLLLSKKPALLLIDAWQSTDLVVINPYLYAGTRVAFVQTMSPAGVAYATSVTARLDRWSNRMRQWIRWMGNDNWSMLSRKIAETQFPEKFRPLRSRQFAPEFKNVPELILSTPAMENDVVVKPYQKLVGFMTDLGRKEAPSSAIDEILRLPATVIFCSLGSVAYEKLSRLKTFLQSLCDVAAQNSRWTFIVSCQRSLHPTTMPSNFLCFERVPQLQVLSKTSVFITHGGFNSIKEAISLHVPMIVYPIDASVDHNGNAARVVSRAIGRSGDIGEGSAQIAQHISDTLSNRVQIIQRMKKMSEEDTGYTDQAFLSTIRDLPSLK